MKSTNFSVIRFHILYLPTPPVKKLGKNYLGQLRFDIKKWNN
jgi:hypothetical protein